MKERAAFGGETTRSLPAVMDDCVSHRQMMRRRSAVCTKSNFNLIAPPLVSLQQSVRSICLEDVRMCYVFS